MGDRKAPSPAPGTPGYKGPPQVRPAPPPAPPPRQAAPAPPAAPYCGVAALQAPTFGNLQADLQAAARQRCPAGCGTPAVTGSPAAGCERCGEMAAFALEVILEMVRQGKVLPRWTRRC